MTKIRSLTRGFTLIELMIAVAVVAILASIAMPSYIHYVRKARRAQAEADMVEYAQRAERYFTSNGTYLNFDTAQSLPQWSPREATTAADAPYRLTYTSSASAFTVTATPRNAQVNDRCGTLTINQTGQKTASSAPLSECW